MSLPVGIKYLWPIPKQLTINVIVSHNQACLCESEGSTYFFLHAILLLKGADRLAAEAKDFNGKFYQELSIIVAGT